MLKYFQIDKNTTGLLLQSGRTLFITFLSFFFLDGCEQWPECALMTCVPRLWSDFAQAERRWTAPGPSPPVFTCLLFVIIAPLLLLSRALVRFFPVPLGQSEGSQTQRLPPFTLILLISTRMKNKQGKSFLHKLWRILRGDAVRRSDM